ncbi:hypothetical protein [Streptomyces lushanensis]|uniref:hypothetical protein n=1 Tax=Streptomyces lushanensis TaxID=1434255 RepID=UPI000B08F502|nr:hypothetical protein [Streptomyces lushanensis]
MPARAGLLSLGDRVRYEGREHSVVALHGTAVRLVDDAQAASVVLLGHLLASEGFAVLGTGPSRPPLPEEGVLEGLPEEEAERVRWWQRHLTELMTGRPDAEPGTPVRAEYDPDVRSVRQRELAKVAELREAGEEVALSTLQRLRARFERERVAGLVDRRLVKPSTGTGRADPRVVAAIEKVVNSRTDEATVSAQVLQRQVERLLSDEHGVGTVAMPSRAAFYRLFQAVSTGRHLLGSARTRRSLGKQPKRMSGQPTAARPGEVMEIDSTPLDVLVVHDDGTVDRCELTGLVQVYLRGLHDNVCVRHRRWLSCGRANVFEQIDLSHAPEVVRAQRFLDRLGRRHGTFALGAAYRHCERFWRETDRRALVRGDRDSVLARIYRPDSKTLPNRFDLIRSQRFHRAANHPQVARFTRLIISLAQRPETERKVAHLTGTTQIEFEQAFRLDHRPRGITLPWLRNGLVGLVEVVADLTWDDEPLSHASVTRLEGRMINVLTLGHPLDQAPSTPTCVRW